MKNKHMIRTLTVLLTVMLCMTAFSTVAFASDGEAATTSEAQTEPTDSADITGGYRAWTFNPCNGNKR